MEPMNTPVESGENISEKPRKKQKHPVRDMVETVLIALAIALLIRTFVFQPFYVPTTSMVPTLAVNDRIIVFELGMRFSEVDRGDVMVFRYPLEPELIYVKRIVGLPGDQLEIREEGVYINGEQLSEDYLPEQFTYAPYGPVTIPEDSFFGLGDNRPDSQDSRYWGFIPRENLVGEAVMIYWPVNRAGLIR